MGRKLRRPGERLRGSRLKSVIATCCTCCLATQYQTCTIVLHQQSPHCPPAHLHPPPPERFGTTSFSQNRHPTRPDQTPVQIPLRHRCLTVHLLFQPRSRRFCSISASHPDTPIREFIRGVLALFLTAPFRHPSSSHPAIEPSSHRAPPPFFSYPPPFSADRTVPRRSA